MENVLNKRLSQIEPSLIRVLKEKANEFDDVIDFTLGEPHFYHEAYEAFRPQFEKQLKRHSLGYPNFYGIDSLKQEILSYNSNRYNLNYELNEIIVTNGCSEGIRAILETILNEGDEVIIFDPYFTLYQSMITLCGGTVVAYDLHETSFEITEEKLRSCMSEKTKAIIVNSPHNPSGHVFNEADYQAMSEVIKDRDLFVISDEIYREFVYSQAQPMYISHVEALRDKIFVVNGVSKSHAMTGWRIGYVLGPVKYMKYIGIVHQNLISCASVVSQYAALEALKKQTITDEIRMYYDENRKIILETLTDSFESFIFPESAFYFYAKIKPNMGKNSYKYATVLLERGKVAVVPSLAFSNKDTGYVRISYCCNKEKLREGIRRIKAFNRTF